MGHQFSVEVRNARADAIETATGASPKLRLYNGTMPATTATALSGNTLLAEGTLPSDWMAAASGGTKVKAGTWTVTGQSGAGSGINATFARIYDNAGTVCHWQGLVKVNVAIATNALTAANGNVLNFASTTGVVVGDQVTGTGILADTQVIAVTGTTATLSRSSTAGVSNGATITFKGDMEMDNTSIANAQVLTVNTYTLIEPNA